MRVLLLTPPMIQVNTPYPATPVLAGCLRRHAPDVEVVQADVALELFLRLFSRAALQSVLDLLRGGGTKHRPRAMRSVAPPPSIACFLEHGAAYVALAEPVIRFLQGKDPALGLRIATRSFLPEGPRFSALGDDEEDPLGWAFGALGTGDRARHLASLFVDDLADVVREGIDPRFELARYGEALAESTASFDPLADALCAEPTLVDALLDELTRELVSAHAPDLVGLTIPFPGCVYGALRIGRVIKTRSPQTRVVLGGGYVNTELRQLSDGRVFDCCDFITLDDGERPLLALIDHLRDPARPLLRTYVREGSRVVLRTTTDLEDLPHRDIGTPTYDGLPLDRYVSLFEMLNPMHRLWADGRWNKLTVARGCYWKKCAFCDLSLNHICRYDPAPAEVLVERIEALVRETGQRGFHFVDEAAPPALLGAVARRLIERGVAISWWGNIRFEKQFTPKLVALLARSGCVAVAGGLEVASDRLLALMKKGVTVAQVARVARDFSDAGILVHAYLMYGFPTQTEQETVDALERVRQLFAEGCIQSGFWHRFAATAHSPIGQRPEDFGVQPAPEPTVTFARNEVPFEDPVDCDHERLGRGLRKALYNFMHGVGLESDVGMWFDERPATRRRGRVGLQRVPAPQVAPDLIRRALSRPR
jgi:radical SAM superfamily enzyme YgiQ (UPF0313 family)